MTFKEFIDNGKTIFTQKYFCFTGRAGRREFWCWQLLICLIFLVFSALPKIGLQLTAIASLATCLPNLGVSVRRLHDTGKSGWMLLLHAIPFVGPVILLICFVLPGDPEDNQFGPPVC